MTSAPSTTIVWEANNAASPMYSLFSHSVVCNKISLISFHTHIVRQNVTASGARPNPQGSFHYGSINVTDVYMLKSLPPLMIDGKLRATYNGISFVNPDTPIRLADVYKVKGAYKLDFPNKSLDRAPSMDRSIINATYKGFIEIILQNNDTVVQTFHLDGYSFFVVGYGLNLKFHRAYRQIVTFLSIYCLVDDLQDGLW